MYKTCLGYVPISSSAPRTLRAAYVPIFGHHKRLCYITTQTRHDCEKIAITGLEPASQDRSS